MKTNRGEVVLMGLHRTGPRPTTPLVLSEPELPFLPPDPDCTIRTMSFISLLPPPLATTTGTGDNNAVALLCPLFLPPLPAWWWPLPHPAPSVPWPPPLVTTPPPPSAPSFILPWWPLPPPAPSAASLHFLQAYAPYA